VVHDVSFALQHHADPAVTKPTPLGRDLLHLLADLRIIRRTVAPDGFGIDTNQPTRPSLRDIMFSHRPERRIPSVV
jgi:hypothetical protein